MAKYVPDFSEECRRWWATRNWTKELWEKHMQRPAPVRYGEGDHPGVCVDCCASHRKATPWTWEERLTCGKCGKPESVIGDAFIDQYWYPAQYSCED